MKLYLYRNKQDGTYLCTNHLTGEFMSVVPEYSLGHIVTVSDLSGGSERAERNLVFWQEQQIKGVLQAANHYNVQIADFEIVVIELP